MLRERPAVVSRARPVAVGDLRNDISALLERLEDDADVELHVQRALDPDFDVVEVYENRNLQSCVCQNVLSSLPYNRVIAAQPYGAGFLLLLWTGYGRSAAQVAVPGSGSGLAANLELGTSASPKLRQSGGRWPASAQSGCFSGR